LTEIQKDYHESTKLCKTGLSVFSRGRSTAAGNEKHENDDIFVSFVNFVLSW